MKCYFCDFEMPEKTEQGYYLGKLCCQNHMADGYKVTVEHHRKLMVQPDRTYLFNGPVESVSFDLLYPPNLPLEEQNQGLVCWWHISHNTFQMDILVPMGEYYEHKEIVYLHHLPQDITPENAYQQAERFLKIRAFI